jgi:hypothetical protein
MKTGTAEAAAERRCRCTHYFQPGDFAWDEENQGWFAFCPMCESEVFRDGLPFRSSLQGRWMKVEVE